MQKKCSSAGRSSVFMLSPVMMDSQPCIAFFLKIVLDSRVPFP